MLVDCFVSFVCVCPACFSRLFALSYFCVPSSVCLSARLFLFVLLPVCLANCGRIPVRRAARFMSRLSTSATAHAAHFSGVFLALCNALVKKEKRRGLEPLGEDTQRPLAFHGSPPGSSQSVRAQKRRKKLVLLRNGSEGKSKRVQLSLAALPVRASQ